MPKPSSTKLRVDSSKNIQESQNSHTFSSTSKFKLQIKAEDIAPRQISLRLPKPQHHRNHTDCVSDQKSIDKKKGIPILNKTYSKNRLKT